MPSKQRYTVDEVIAAINDTKGMVYLAAQKLGCDAKTIYNYRDRYASVRAAMEQQDGMVNDIAEMKLYQAIMAGEMRAVEFRLRTKAKDRGYTERQELSGVNGKPIETEVSSKPDLSRLSLDELLTWRKLAAKAAQDGEKPVE